MKVRGKIWLGLGTIVIAGSTIADPWAAIAAGPDKGQGQHQHGSVPASTVKISGQGEGGEGGEGGEAGAQLSPALKTARGFGLIRGHLLVGDELVQQGRWTEALPHFLHPSEEIYGTLKGELKSLGIRPFESALKALAQTVKAGKREAYANALKLVNDQLSAGEAILRQKEADWPRFVLEAALETLRQAPEEYKEAIEDGRFAKVVEYQDARGFVWQAQAMIESVAPELERRDAKVIADLRTQFAELKAAWPSVVPPAQPVKDSSAVYGAVARVELAAGDFLK